MGPNRFDLGSVGQIGLWLCSHNWVPVGSFVKLGSYSWATLELNEPWLKTGIEDWAQLGKSCMGSCWAINWVPVGFCNLILNLTKYINIINFIYIIDKRKKNN